MCFMYVLGLLYLVLLFLVYLLVERYRNGLKTKITTLKTMK